MIRSSRPPHFQVMRGLRRTIIVGIAAIFIAVVVVFLVSLDPSIRHLLQQINSPLTIILALGALIGAGDTLVRVILALMEAHENIQKLVQGTHHLFTPKEDIERMESLRPQFADRNEPTYVERREIRIIDALMPRRYPQIVEIIAPPGAGKTRMLHYLIYHRLLANYRGRIIFVRGEERDHETDNDLVVLDEVLRSLAIPTFDGIDQKRNAIHTYFQSYFKNAWLIILADIQPSGETASTLIGVKNTLVLAYPSPLASEQRLVISRIAEKNLHFAAPIKLSPFTPKQAMKLFTNTVGKVFVHPSDRAILAHVFQDVYPAYIVRLARAYQQQRAAINSSATEKKNTPLLVADYMTIFGALLIQGIGQHEQMLLITLAIMIEPHPQKILPVSLGSWLPLALFSPPDSPDKAQADERIYRHTLAACKEQGLLEVRPSSALLTPFGIAIARYLLETSFNSLVADVKVRLVTAYRAQVRAVDHHDQPTTFLKEEIHHILALWSVVGLNHDDTILFAHALRDQFLPSGELSRGYDHLQEALEIARYRPPHQQQQAEMALAAAEIALALKRPSNAIADLTLARPYYEQSGHGAQLAILDHLAREAEAMDKSNPPSS